MSNVPEDYVPRTAEELREENYAKMVLTVEENLAKHRMSSAKVDPDHQEAFERLCEKLGWKLHKLENAWIVEI